MRSPFVRWIAAVILAAGAVAGPIVYQRTTGGEAANIWVDTDGGTCTRSASPAEYSSAAACASFDAAWDALNAGDTGRIKNGSYGFQNITGNKASTTKLIGESQAGVTVGPPGECVVAFGGDQSLCVSGTNFWLEDVTLDSDTAIGDGITLRVYPGGDNMTLVNVDMIGDYVRVYIDAPSFTWRGGSHGEDGVVTPDMTCSQPQSQPIQFESTADGSVLDGIRMNPKFVLENTPGPQCGGDNTPHMEAIRVNGAATNLTFKNLWFVEGGEWGSGYLFFSGAGSATGLKVINNVFGCNASEGVGNCSHQWTDANPSSPCDISFLYNTWQEDVTGGTSNLCTSSLVVAGNVGPQAALGCVGSHVKNVWSGSGSCGTDTFTGGAASALGIDSNGNLEAGSPGIDAAETPGASDHCTDAATVNSLDRHGGSRPVGSVCDAGADERD